MKKIFTFVVALICGITHILALDYIDVANYDSELESICMRMTDTLTVSVDAGWESGLDSHSWKVAGDLTFASGYDENSNPCKIVSTSNGYGKGRITYKFKDGRCSSMEYIDVFKMFPRPSDLEIKGPECVIDSQEVVYSIDPMLTKNLGDEIGIDTYTWNILESAKPFVHKILYVSSDSSSVTFQVGHVDPQNPPVLTVSVGRCNTGWSVSKQLGNATPKPDLPDTMYLPVGFGDFKVGVINPKPNMEYTWSCPSFAIEPFGASRDSAIIHIAGQDADKMEFEVYVNATYTDITCNNSADTMKVVRTWGHTQILDKNNIKDSCYTQNNSYTFAVEGELPINTKCDWRLPQGWNFYEEKVSDLKTIKIYPTSSAKLKDTLFVKPLNPHDTANPDTLFVHVRPMPVPVGRIMQNSCLRYNETGIVYIDTTGMNMPEGVWFEWSAPHAEILNTQGTDTLRFTPSMQTNTVSVTAKGINSCDAASTEYTLIFEPQKPDSIIWEDSACVSFNMPDTLTFTIANALPGQKYEWTKPAGWSWGDTLSSPKDLAVTIELISNGEAGTYIVSAKGVNAGGICTESAITSREVIVPTNDDYIIAEPGSWGICKLYTRDYTSSSVNWYLLNNGERVTDFEVYSIPIISDGVVSSVTDLCDIVGTNYTLVAEVEYSDGCKARLQYGTPVSNLGSISFDMPQNRQTLGSPLQTKEHKMLLSPNPALHELNIDLKDKDSQKAELYIIDIQGKVVASSKTFNLGTSYNVSSIPVGQYLILIQQGKKRYVEFFLKQ